jgi:hypothetical protein
LVIELPANITTVRDDGVTGEGRIGQGLHGYSPGENRTWTTVKFTPSPRLHGRYTLSPGEENITEIKEFPPEFTIAVIVYRSENEIISFGTATCSDHALLGFRVVRRIGPSGGITLTYECG